MSQKVLTFYGDRGWLKNNCEYNKGSIIRGYESLNQVINRFARSNPDVTIQSVSYSHIEVLGEEALLIFATVLYTGEPSKQWKESAPMASMWKERAVLPFGL